MEYIYSKIRFELANVNLKCKLIEFAIPNLFLIYRCLSEIFGIMSFLATKKLLN